MYITYGIILALLHTVFDEIVRPLWALQIHTKMFQMQAKLFKPAREFFYKINSEKSSVTIKISMELPKSIQHLVQMAKRQISSNKIIF